MNAPDPLTDAPDWFTQPWKLPEPIKQDIGAIILARHVLAVVNGDEQARQMYESMPKGEPEF
jgi:hypothetical protein